MKKKLQSPAIALALGLFLAAHSGCAGPAAPAKATVENPPAAPIAEQLSGKVAETLDAGGYTYVCVEKDGKKKWAAIPTTKLKVGQQVELKSGAIFTDFESKSLNRTFDSIVFSAGLQEDAAPQVAPQDAKY